jgi:phosphoribosylamine-glycine ligase
MEFMNSVLVLGSGACEHGMVKALLRGDRPLCMYAYPGNSSWKTTAACVTSVLSSQ